MRYLLLSVLVVCVIGIMVPSVFAEEELGIKCPVKTSTPNYEMIFECNKKLDVNKAILDSMFEDINWISGSFNDAKLSNIKENDSFGTATMEIPVVVTTLKSDIKFTKSGSNYQIDFLTGKLAGSKMSISVSMTSGFDKTPNMGSDISLNFSIKKKMCINIILINKCSEPNDVMYALDKGLVLLEPKAKIFQRDHPELISNPSISNSSEQEKIHEEIKKAPEVKKIEKEFELLPKQEYFPVATLPQTISGNDKITIETKYSIYRFGEDVALLTTVPYVTNEPILLEFYNAEKKLVLTDSIYPDSNGFGQKVYGIGNELPSLLFDKFTVFATYGDSKSSTSFELANFGFFIELDRTEYTSTDKVHIMIVAPNLNRNSNIVDTIGNDDSSTITISSDRNYLTNYKLVERGKDTGIFEGEITLVADQPTSGIGPTGGKLSTYPGDELQVWMKVSDFSFIATADIITNLSEIASFGFENARVVDEFGTTIPEVTVDQQIQIITDVINGEEKNQSFAYVMTVENSAGDAVAVEWTTSTLDSGQSTSPALSWTPQVTGSYTVSLAVWKSLDDPTPLARMLTLEINVMDTDRKYTSPPVTTSEVPAWVKNNAGWWAEGQIPDSAFLQGIQFLIKEGIMVIPPTETSGSSESQEVPGWIKNNAEWWAAGQIDDSTFVSGIQYLVKVGIIKVS